MDERILPIENLDKNCYLIISNNSFLFSSYLNNFLAIENTIRWKMTWKMQKS